MDEIPDRVRHELKGPTSCTHLSSLRSIADIEHLLELATDRPSSFISGPEAMPVTSTSTPLIP